MINKETHSPSKKKTISLFHDHVSSGKTKFFQSYGMDFVMGRREGPFLWDKDGKKRLFNLHNNGGVFNLGHRNEEIVDVLKSSLDEWDIGNHHLLSTARADLANLLSKLMPDDLTYTVFGASGGESVDLAIKVARSYTGHPKIISAVGSYHGHTGLAMATGDKKYREPFGPQLPGFQQVPFGDIEALSSALGSDTAAVILETVPATLGIRIPTLDYIQSVRRLCSQKKTLLILDEVQTGLGRTGKLWGFEHYGIVPDMVILGKGLSGGIYPITATVIRKPLESVFHKDPFIHISTFGGSELGCRVAQRVLEISSQPAFLDRINRLAERFAEGIGMLMDKHSGFLLGLRQLGLMMGLKFSEDICGPLVTKTAYDSDLLLIYANNDTSVCQFLPPLVMEDDDVDWVVAQMDKAIATARRLKPILKAKRTMSRFKNSLRKEAEGK